MEQFAIPISILRVIEAESYSHFFIPSNNSLLRYLSFLFKQHILKLQYSNFNSFCDALRIVKISNDKKSLCFLTVDNYFVHISLGKKERIIDCNLNCFNGLSICDIDIAYNKLIIASNFAYNIDFDSFIIIDLITKSVLKRISLNKTSENNIKKISMEKFKECVSYDGYCKHIPSKKICFKAICASFNSQRHLVDKKNSIKKYTVDLCWFNYAENEPVENHNLSYEIDFSNPLTMTNSKLKCLILRPNNGFSMVALALNSTYKIYCQLIILSLNTNYGIL